MVFLLTRPTWCYSIFLLFTFFTTVILLCGAEVDEYDIECSSNFTCGNINVSCPFCGNNRQPSCGLKGYELNCQEEYGYPQLPFIHLDNKEYLVLRIDQKSLVMTIARRDLLENSCSESPHDTLFNTTIYYIEFVHATGVTNVTKFHGCIDPNPLEPEPNKFPCPYDANDHWSVGFFFGDSMSGRELQYYNSKCSGSIKVPVLQVTFENLTKKQNRLQQDVNVFDVKYSIDKNCSACGSSGGFCGKNISSSTFECHRGSKKGRLGVIIGVASGVVGLGIVLATAFFINQRRKPRKYARTSYTSRSFLSVYSSSRTDFENGGACYGLPIFDYEELKEATDNFDQKKEVGDGGFGTVYKGTLRDGRVVAIKRLYENNYKRQEQFLNEVEILARLRHPNLVTLYGCTSPDSQRLLLVYEYISNGTIADHLHGDRAKPGSLPWLTRLNIAIETAAALLHLHRSDVIHRDVKTYNILLDDNFSVKVADFGLSRLYPLNVTHVSTAPQGTPGYVDPEYHECYQLTEKSDVYSFGVVLMELISSLPAVDITRHGHDINLSNMAINMIQRDALHELVDKHLGFDCNDNVRRMIIAVAELAFQCLQYTKEMRPCMEEVLETLESIQKQDKPTDKAQEMDSLSDDAVLLKSELMYSPDSVTVKLDSALTTPNASG